MTGFASQVKKKIFTISSTNKIYIFTRIDTNGLFVIQIQVAARGSDLMDKKFALIQKKRLYLVPEWPAYFRASALKLTRIS